MNLDPKQQAALERKLSTLTEDGMPTLVKPAVNFQEPVEDTSVYTRSNDDLKAKIAELERELGAGAPSSTLDAKTFMDNSGNETFYVKNFSGRHVLISDLDIPKIPVGETVDLLKYASIEDLKKSRDLRTALYGIGKDQLLKRVTELEYYEAMRQAVSQKKKVDIVRQQEILRLQNQQSPNQLYPHERPAMAAEKKIRPAIEAKLGKLNLIYDKEPENARLAMSAPEFISWVQNEQLTHAEIEHIMGHPAVNKQHDIRAALLEKKASTPME